MPFSASVGTLSLRTIADGREHDAGYPCESKSNGRGYPGAPSGFIMNDADEENSRAETRAALRGAETSDVDEHTI